MFTPVQLQLQLLQTIVIAPILSNTQQILEKLKNALHGLRVWTLELNTSTFDMMGTMNVEHALLLTKDHGQGQSMTGHEFIFTDLLIG